MKLYDLIKKLLMEDVELRNSDKKLIWATWQELGLANESITYENFLKDKCPLPESIRRCRQKIQETHPELEATVKVKKLRKERARQKGTHIYREAVADKKSGYWDTSTGTARWIDR